MKKSIFLILAMLLSATGWSQTAGQDTLLSRGICKNKKYFFEVLDHTYNSGKKVVICEGLLPLEIKLINAETESILDQNDVDGVISWTEVDSLGAAPHAIVLFDNKDTTTLTIELGARFTEQGSGKLIDLSLKIKIDRRPDYLRVSRKHSVYSQDENYIDVYDEYDAYQPDGLDWFFQPLRESTEFTFKGKFLGGKIERNIHLSATPDDLDFNPERLTDKGRTEVRTTVATQALIHACDTNHAVVFSADTLVEVVDVFNISYLKNGQLKKPGTQNGPKRLIASLNRIYEQVNVRFELDRVIDVRFDGVNSDGILNHVSRKEQESLKKFILQKHYGKDGSQNKILVFRIDNVGSDTIVGNDGEPLIRRINGRATSLEERSLIIDANDAPSSTIAHEVGHAVYGMRHPSNLEDTSQRYYCDIVNLMYFSSQRGKNIDCSGEKNKFKNIRGTLIRHLDWKNIHE